MIMENRPAPPMLRGRGKLPTAVINVMYQNTVMEISGIRHYHTAGDVTRMVSRIIIILYINIANNMSIILPISDICRERKIRRFDT